MPFPDHLQDDEQVLVHERRDARSALDGVLATVAVLGAAGAAAALGQGRLEMAHEPWYWPAVVGAMVALAALALVPLALRVRTTRYTVTDQRVYALHGRLRFNLLQTTYDKVTDLHVRQGVFGRAFGFGTLTLNTPGTNVAFHGVRDPFGLKRTVEAARTAFLQRLVGEHQAQAQAGLARSAMPDAGPWASTAGAAAPAVAPSQTEAAWQHVDGAGDGTVPAHAHPEAGPDDALTWSARPAPFSFLERAIGMLLLLLLGLGLLTAALAAGTQTLPLGAGLALLAVVNIVAAFIRYRTSHYAITRTGIVVTTGWLGRRRSETTFSKVTDVTTTQGLIGRLAGFGTIQVNTAGAARAAVTFVGVAEPERVKALIDAARGSR